MEPIGIEDQYSRNWIGGSLRVNIPEDTDCMVHLRLDIPEECLRQISSICRSTERVGDFVFL